MRLVLVSILITSSALGASFDRLAFTFGGASHEQQLAVDSSRFWQISDSKFYFGTGLRLTSQWSTGHTFRTAPASLTRGESGIGAIFKPEKKSNIDELGMGHSQVTSLNVLVQILYRWKEKWSIGANIDLIGASFGKLRRGGFNPKKEDGSWPEEVSARPTPFNLLLGDDNDRGSINSEVYVHRTLDQNWGVKLGVVHAFSEYTTTRKLRNNNDRFRKKNYLPTLGLTRVF
jgi:hypothetical protein